MFLLLYKKVVKFRLCLKQQQICFPLAARHSSLGLFLLQIYYGTISTNMTWFETIQAEPSPV
jgi:hypothetical protein